jgi:hypothetical protein
MLRYIKICLHSILYKKNTNVYESAWLKLLTEPVPIANETQISRVRTISTTSSGLVISLAVLKKKRYKNRVKNSSVINKRITTGTLSHPVRASHAVNDEKVM